MTYSQLVKFIMAEYPESDIMLSIEDRPLGDIAVQYKETDWIFLKGCFLSYTPPFHAGSHLRLYSYMEGYRMLSKKNGTMK